jgi:DNA-binding CsgD family transcriptional regulator
LEEGRKKAIASRDRLLDLVEGGSVPTSAEVGSRIKNLEAGIKELNRQIGEVASETDQNVPPISRETVIEMLADIRAVLTQGVSIAAPVLRKLLGKVYVQEIREPGKKTVWVARVHADLVPIMADMSRAKKCPDSFAWVKLNKRKWTLPVTAEILIGNYRPQYQAIAPKVTELVAEGLPNRVVARTLGVHLGRVTEAVAYTKYGRRFHAANTWHPKYKDLAPKIAQLVADGLSNREAATKLGISVTTIYRAKVYATSGRLCYRPKANQGKGQPNYQKIAPQVAQLVADGLTNEAVAVKPGISPTMAYAARCYARDGRIWGETPPAAA